MNEKNIKIIQPLENKYAYHVYHLYVIRLKNRNKLMKILRDNNIFAGIHYVKAVHQQKIFKSKKFNLKNTEKVVKEIISLPIYPGLEIKVLKKIVKIINNF